MPSVFIVWAKQISGVSECHSFSQSVSSLISNFCVFLCLCSLCSLSSLFLFLALSLFPSISLSLITGTYSRSAAIQLRGNSGRDHHVDGLLLNRPHTPTPPNGDPRQSPARKHLVEHQQGQPISDPGPSKRTMEGLVVVRVGTGIGKIAGQESASGGGEVSSYYRHTRRGSPRPSTHNDFDINEHLPWMIVLLLLLVLVVIVVCSVKRSSHVLKKGPMQDPSSIMEKAIQKKPSVPPTQVKEKWIYYSNGQGKTTFSVVLVKNMWETALAHTWVSH